MFRWYWELPATEANKAIVNLGCITITEGADLPHIHTLHGLAYSHPPSPPFP